MAKIKGFTLIEIMVVAGIMALFSLTLISVFLATSRGGSKAQLIQAVHQEGDFALKQMVATVRNSRGVSCAGNTLTVEGLSGAAIVFSLASDGGVNRIASDSSRFLTGKTAAASNLGFICDSGVLGNQVVTISFWLDARPGGGGQVQEQWRQHFATSVSTRQY